MCACIYIYMYVCSSICTANDCAVCSDGELSALTVVAADAGRRQAPGPH